MTEYEAWLFLICLKAVRLTQAKGPHDDSSTDGAVYFGLAGEAKHREKPQTVAGLPTIRDMISLVNDAAEAVENIDTPLLHTHDKSASVGTLKDSPEVAAWRDELKRQGYSGWETADPPWGEWLRPARREDWVSWVHKGRCWQFGAIGGGVPPYPLPVIGHHDLRVAVVDELPWVRPPGWRMNEEGFWHQSPEYRTVGDSEVRPEHRAEPPAQQIAGVVTQESAAGFWVERLIKAGVKPDSAMVPPWGIALPWVRNQVVQQGGLWRAAGKWWLAELDGVRPRYPIPVKRGLPFKLDDTVRNYLLPEGFAVADDGCLKIDDEADRVRRKRLEAAQEQAVKAWKARMSEWRPAWIQTDGPPWGTVGHTGQWFRDGVLWIDRVNGGEVPYPIPVINTVDFPYPVNRQPLRDGTYVMPAGWTMDESGRLKRIESPSENPDARKADPAPADTAAQPASQDAKSIGKKAITRKAIVKALQRGLNPWCFARGQALLAARIVAEAFDFPSGEPDEPAQQPEAGQAPAVHAGVDVPAQGAGGVPVVQPESAAGQ
jgi:hypothetical protein